MLRLSSTVALTLALTALPAPAQLLRGYLGVPNEAPGPEFGGGFSMHVAAWPLLEEWPGTRFQTGLFGTWMFAQKPERELEGQVYSDIEGGLGWWRDTRFATATPKFIMGGVTLNFAAWANGPGAGKGRDWDQPLGKYGVAQLSPWLLWPPDGLNLAQGTCGELFGYGYLPLPLIDARERTAGRDVPTGDRAWTLFLDTANFKGPVACFTPFFFAEPTLERTDLAGVFLDARPADPARALQMETQWVPAAIESGRRGTFARTAPVRFPANGDDASVLVHRITSFRTGTLFDAVRRWFDGGEPCSGAIPADAGHVHTVPGHGWSTWKVHADDTPDEEQRGVAWDSFAEPTAIDAHTFGLRWDEQWVQRPRRRDDPPLFTLPEYFELDERADGPPVWRPVERRRVTERRALERADFAAPESYRPEPYVTPDDGVWASPGPVAGPFEAELGDGSVVTYAWYRFVDQPALAQADLTDDERERLQARAERLHRAWTRDRTYLPPPTLGELASLDPALIVEPPAGLEIGHVPIVTRQAAR